MNKNLVQLITVGSLAAAGAFAGPITTVPWNGHDGAVSFTFDDGSSDQLQQLGTYFNDNPDVKVTFFITGAMYAGAGDISSYVNYAKNGHEIGNHSKSHQDMTGGVNLNDETSGWKSSLLNKGAPEVYSFATPYCASNGSVANAISKDHIANRNCAGAKYYAWGSEPDWMDISSNCYTQGGNSTGNAKNNMASAKQQKGWTVQLNHTIGSSDQYGISTNDMKSIMNEAKNQGLWIAPFGVVAAYYRAHFVLDKVSATASATGTKYSWQSPHSAMPKSVMMKVKIDGADGKTVSQKGKVISPNVDGTFTIDFMALELEVAGEPPKVEPFKGAIEIPGTVEAENYDTYAYSDSDGGNDATGYRSDDAGVVKTDNGYGLGYTNAGDYFEYTLDVKTAGTYKVTVRGSTGNSTAGTVTVKSGESSVAVEIASTGDWNTYEEFKGGEITLAAGKQTLRLTIENDYLNVDWIKIAGDDASSGETPDDGDKTAIAGVRHEVPAGQVRCQVFDMNGHLVKSVDVFAGAASEVWSRAKAGVPNGMYIMRYGSTAKSMQTVRVQK